MNRALQKSYEAYWEAFSQDLNHYYSGLNALQVGTIFLMLSKDDDTWKDAFNNDDEADAYMRKLSKNVENLRTVVSVSIEAKLSQLDRNNPDRFWAEISEADVLFLTEERERRITGAYKNAIPADNPFALDAAKSQLKLFAALGMKADIANTVIGAIDEHFGKPEPPQDQPEAEAAKPLHVIVFAGHQVDAPKRSKPRFPAETEEQAKTLIKEALENQRNQDHRLRGLASASPGADILFHEVCDELDIPTTVCLPMPSDDYARLTFKDLDQWRSRFLDLRNDENVLVLSDQEGLPNWLHGADVDPWERGNRWVMQMALTSVTSKEDKITLIALWDGKKRGDKPGGTAHMVELARDAGEVHVKIIESTKLLP